MRALAPPLHFFPRKIRNSIIARHVSEACLVIWKGHIGYAAPKLCGSIPQINQDDTMSLKLAKSNLQSEKYTYTGKRSDGDWKYIGPITDTVLAGRGIGVCREVHGQIRSEICR